MSSPVRVQRKRTKGYRLPPNTVSVCRPGKWGNPFTVERFGNAAVPLFRDMASGTWDPRTVAHMSDALCHEAYELHQAWRKRIGRHPVEAMWQDLKGKNLACYCALSHECHADILLELANQ